MGSLGPWLMGGQPGWSMAGGAFSVLGGSLSTGAGSGFAGADGHLFGMVPRLAWFHPSMVTFTSVFRLRLSQGGQLNPDVPLKASLDLQSHIVPGIVKTSIAFVIRGCYPAAPDHGQQHVAAPDPVANDLREACTYVDVVDIEEDPIVPQAHLERFSESVRRVWHVFAAIAHKHPNIAFGPTASFVSHAR